MSRGLRATVVLTGLLGAMLAWAQASKNEPQMDLPRASLRIAHAHADVQLAMTTQQQQKGLMYRAELSDNEGMLFVFEKSERLCFWMKNTPLDLTVAFVAGDGRIVALADMQAQSKQQHCSPLPVRFALEMPRGWFAQHNILPGMRVEDVQGELFQQR